MTERGRGDFGLLLAGNGVSAFGNSLFLVGLMLYFSNSLISPLMLGVAQAAAFIPMFLLSYSAGVLADRASRPRILAVSDLIRGAGLGLTAWLLPRAEAVGESAGLLLVLLVLVMGSMQALFQPAVVSLVSDLPRAEGGRQRDRLALRTAVNHLASLAGQGLGGLALTLVGFPTLLLYNALGFSLSGLSELLIREPRKKSPPKGDSAPQLPMTAVLSELRSLNRRGAGIDLFILNQFLLPLFTVSFPFFIQYRLELSQSYVGYLFASVLAGSIAASLLRGRGRPGTKPRSVYFFGLLLGLIALGATIPGPSPRLWPLFAGAVSLGFAVASVYLHTLTAVQYQGRAESKGRRHGSLEAVSGGLTPLAYLIGGISAELLPLGSGLIFLISGSIIGLFCLYKLVMEIIMGVCYKR